MNPDARAETVARIEACGVVAVIRLQDGSRLRAVVDALAAGGITALEVTMTVPRAIELIAQIAPALPDGFVVGAGTVTDPGTARAATAAGARFIVGPVFRPAVIEASHAAGAAAMPGCFSPTEILAAWDAGADVVKVFPATALEPSYFKDLQGPMPHVRLMPTGGVSLENAGDWIRAGAVAIGVGGALVDPRLAAAGDYAAITDRAKRFVERVRHAREASA
ncbi:MAG: bifunctional 4-hydroxy-2-oxoglutarate aldolase/2-dehydro-3-deoxy-phosphogluconate aldolase [Rhodospirillaceae bacterium]